MSSISSSEIPINGKDEAKDIKSSRASYELDLSKVHSLSSEQQDLYLFTFITNLEKRIKSLDEESLKQHQANLKKELLRIVSLPTPPPTRAVRQSIGRCFGQIFGRGDRRLLFETITELGDLLNTTKVEKDLRCKHASVFCLGEIYEAAGDGAINLSGVICASLLRLFKSATNHISIRAAILKTLGKMTASIKSSLDESVAREVWKQARVAASTDRGALVQIHGCWCLEKLIQHTDYFYNTIDFDSLKLTMWKAGDSAVPAVRHASASCLATIMVRAYMETPSAIALAQNPRTRKPRKIMPGQNGVDLDGDEPDAARLASPTWKKSFVQLELALLDILRQLSTQYVRPTTSNRGRAAIMDCYFRVLQSLGVAVVESNFDVLAEHFLVEILNNVAISQHRYRLLITRRFVQKILADLVGRQILGESAQLAAARSLINSIIKTHPPKLKETSAPSKLTLTGTLGVLASFISSLGSAFSPLTDACRDALLQALQHPSYTVQIHASHCLRQFTLACPQQLLQCASICMNSVDRELGFLGTGRHSPRKCIGYANGLAAVLSISSLQPLYSSLEISSRVLKQATSLLKSSALTEFRISGIQVQVAWIMIGGLLSLGPNFVKIHLSQLHLMWKNALPRPLMTENAGQYQIGEISYLTHVRECALGSMLSFLEFNSRLLTSDVSKRIASLLQNTVEFLESLPSTKADGDSTPRFISSLQLSDLVQMVRRRVMQCFTRLATRSPQTSTDLLSQTNLLTFAVSCFAEPESYTQGSLGTTIANAASTFESIWNVSDNSGFGVSGMMKGLSIDRLPGEQVNGKKPDWHRQNEPNGRVDSLLSSPVCGALEHDFVFMHLQEMHGVDQLPDPPATEVVNSAIALFAVCLPLQESKIQESILEQLSVHLSAKSLQRDPGRKAAVTVNISLALLGALKVSAGETSANAGNLGSPAVEKCLDEFLRTLIIDPDKHIRNAAYEALGRLCNGAGNSFTTNVVNSLVDTIVTNREPNARAGCAMALGSIHANVGGIAAGFHLRKIHGVLMSLCSDPHPTVHFWAIEALSKVAESAGLTFSSYMPSTLGLLAQLWLSDTHCDEADTVGTSNAELEMPTPAAVAHTIASLINVLGPDLQDMAKARDLILTLVRQFDLDQLALVQGQSLQCWEHIYLYAPSFVDFERYVHQLQQGLGQLEYVRNIAIDGLCSLIRRSADETLHAAAEGFEEHLLNLLNEACDQSGIKNILESWMAQTGLTDTAQWITRFQELMSKTVVRANDSAAMDSISATVIQDDEVAGFAQGNAKDGGTQTVLGQELLRWQVRAFALHCLNDLIATVARDGQTSSDSRARSVLQSKIADVIRIAFLASTSSVVELRIGGLKMINQILALFGRTPDPDFAEALLLEQYQAQISSALTPAFGSDSSPELASAAITVCATFISTGLVTDVDRMGRILKLLVSALASFTVEIGHLAIGELRGLSSNAQTMVKMAVLSAWAELQVASTEQAYLIDVVKPHIASLTPLWLSSLQEFARLKFEPDISSSMGINPDDGLDTIYAAMNRQTLLKFYQDAWLDLINAIASLIDQDSKLVYDALDGKRSAKRAGVDKPVVFFFLLFGITFEALMTRPRTDAQASKDRTLEILLALKKILRPSVSGHAIYQDVVFTETMELLDRLALTEGLVIQRAIVEIAGNLCLSHPSVNASEADGNIADDIEQLFELTRIIVLVLAGLLPHLSNPTPLRYQISDEAVPIIILALGRLVDASEAFPAVIRSDLHACIFHIFTTILGTAVCQAVVVPKTLPVFKRFIVSVMDEPDEHAALAGQIRNCLVRFRAILANAQRRESEASLLCAKNTLLASVILLTSASDGIPSDEPSVQKLLDDLLDCLQDVGLGKVAANCIRSLLLSNMKNETDRAMARYLVPRLLFFISDASQEDPEDAARPIIQTLVAFVGTFDEEESATALAVVIPMLLARAQMGGTEWYPTIAGQLLSLAGTHQGAFKGTVTRFDSEQKALLEEIIRTAGVSGATGGEGGESKGEPSISLKMTFGR